MKCLATRVIIDTVCLHFADPDHRAEEFFEKRGATE